MIHPGVLEEMNHAQLKEFADKMGVKVHHKAKDETIRKVILDQVNSRESPKVIEDREEIEIVAPKVNTQEEVLEAIGPLKDGFKVDFPGDDTVIFTYRGISESIHLTAPLHLIKRQAIMAAKPKYAPAMEKDGQFGNTGIMMMR